LQTFLGHGSRLTAEGRQGLHLVPQYRLLSLNADGTVYEHHLVLVGRNRSSLAMRRPGLAGGIQYRRENPVPGSGWPCSSGGRAVAMERGGRFAVAAFASCGFLLKRFVFSLASLRLHKRVG
jgi:hypothetical protein